MSSFVIRPEALEPSDHRPPASAVLSLVERLVEEMVQRWHLGERPLAEEFLQRHPELCQQPETALELIAEELSLRQEHGLATDLAGLQRRFPQWRRQVQVLAHCHQLLAPSAPPASPAIGETLGDFRLVAELGRGSQGSVFLATQPSLAGRPVVLKLSLHGSVEHLCLARLQHTHIVPLYSAHEFPAHGLCGLCLPYLGGLTLATLLDRLRDRLPEQRAGRDLLTALQQHQATAAVTVSVSGPACRWLERASWVQAVCWMGACLADALHYAHERGLVHLDVKPSNVLLAADGQPLLLDFHLAHEQLSAGASAPVALGGTPGYMAPEHAAALEAVRDRQPIPGGVDGRTDVYALGLVLFEALSGVLPCPAEMSAALLRRANPRVTIGLADILMKCLAAAPSRRYATARALAIDLRRHLADLPLRAVPNRSPTESWRKWRRRRPYALPLLGLLAVALASGAALLDHVNRQANKARTALEQGQQRLHAGHYAEALDAYRHGLALAEDLPFTASLVPQLHDGAQLAERAQAAGDLHRSCERIRTWYGVDLLPAEQVRAANDLCAQVWRNRQLIVDRLDRQPMAGLDEQVRSDLVDVAILWADLQARHAPAGDMRRAREEALRLLDQAEEMFGPSCVLQAERRSHQLALAPAGPAPRPAGIFPARNAWEHCALGRAYLRAGNVAQAMQEIDAALALQPQALWANFYKGRCAFQLGQYDDAVVAFSVCVALAPGSAGCVYHRGLAYLEQGRLDRALADFDEALRLDPALIAAALSRGILHFRAKRYREALTDLRRARIVCPDYPDAWFNEALVHVERDDRVAAITCVRRALALEPAHGPARLLLTRLEPQP